MKTSRSTLTDANKRRPEAVFEGIYRYLYGTYREVLSSDSRSGRTPKWMKRLQIIDSTTITLFSNLIFKGVGRHPKTGKKKGGIKVHAVIHANEGVPSDVRFTSAATNDDKFQVTESRGLFAFSDKNLEILRKSADWSSSLDDVKRVEVLKGEIDKRIKFSSPDLSLFNLHGPVKELVVSYTGLRDGATSLFEHPDDSKVYRFTEDGEWLHDFYQVKRNSNGYITSVYKDSEAYYYPYDNYWYVGQFSWNGKNLRSFDLYPISSEFSYKDGKISEISTSSVQSMISSDKIKLSKFRYDEYGNWISCNWKEKVTTEFYDSIPETKTYSGTMNRRIEYY